MSRPLTPRTKRERMPGGSVAVSSGVASIGSSRYYLRTLNLWRNYFFAFQPSLAFDPGQAVLDPGLRPGAPRHGEELEPLLDEEVRVHPGRDEIHPGGDAVLRGGRRDFIECSLIGVAGVVERHPQLDRKVGGADQQDVDARDRGGVIEILKRLVGLDHRHDKEPVVHSIEVIAVILELAPLARTPALLRLPSG